MFADIRWSIITAVYHFRKYWEQATYKTPRKKPNNGLYIKLNIVIMDILV